MQMWLPLQMLWHITGDLEEKYRRAPAVVVVCPECRQVQLFQMPPNNFPAGKGPMVMKPRLVDVDWCDWLQCEMEGCKVPLPLYPMWIAGITGEAALEDAATWQWDGLYCPNGHPIPKPVG